MRLLGFFFRAEAEEVEVVDDDGVFFPIADVVFVVVVDVLAGEESLEERRTGGISYGGKEREATRVCSWMERHARGA